MLPARNPASLGRRTKTQTRSAGRHHRDFGEKRKPKNPAVVPASPTGGAASPESSSPGSPEGARFSTFNETLQALTPGPACPRANRKAAPSSDEPAHACLAK